MLKNSTFLFTFFILFLLPMIACNSLSELTSTPIPLPTNTPEPGEVATNLIFTGKVINENSGLWPNNRLVVLYLKGEEIGRTITDVGENNLSGEGLTDGFFSIEVPNTYEVPVNRFDFNMFPHSSFELGIGFLTWPFMNVWLGNVSEGSLNFIPVPTKNITYALKVFAGEIADLPPEILGEGSTQLTEDNQVVLLLSTIEGSSSRVLIQGIKYGLSQETVEINKITVPINNCGGNSPVSQEYSYTQTYYHEYKAEASAGAEIDVPTPIGWPQVLIELQANYGFEQGQINSQEVSYHMEAQAGTKIVYTVTWQEVWESGSAIVGTGDGSLEVPFRVRTNVIYNIESEEFDCG